MTQQRTYKAIFFDLDGTLLPMDTAKFMKSYLSALGRYVAQKGLDPMRVVKAVGVGSKNMMTNPGTHTNETVFWEGFCEYMGDTRETWESVITPFYTEHFDELGHNVTAVPEIRKAIDTLKDQGYPLILSTMPMFPRVAVDFRLEWAGLRADEFAYISTFENSHSTKPHTAYYQEILDANHLDARDVLLVGNNTLEDGAITKLGSDIFLITDFLLNVPGGVDISAVKHGTVQEFLAFCKTLPHA